jgi:cytosine/adenosine deaminase-related metal-dependent hydrolase
VVESYDAVGIRAVVGHPDPHSAADVARLVNDTGTVTGGLAILGPVRGSWEDTRRQLRLAREIGAVVSMHAQGGGQDSAVSELFRAGLLGADLNLIHLNDVTDDEAKMLVDAGAGTTVTPLVEATMGHGMSPYGRLRDNGGRVALGVDVVVNSVPDLFEPLRDTLRTERLRTGTMRPAASVLPAATIDSARAIGLADQIGTLEVGKRADIVLLDGLAHLTGAGSVAGAVVTSAGPANVHTVLVNGKLVKRDGRLLQHNLAELRAAATNLARRVLFSG